jgi:hypothetical protein
MELTSLQARKIYKRFAWGLLISLAFFLGSAFLTILTLSESSVFLADRPLVGDLAPYVALASIFASFVTFVGFFISNALAWKKEQRERAQFELEAQIKMLEIEKLRRELARVKSAGDEVDSNDP